MTLLDLQKGQVAVIASFDIQKVPLKLIEMGCMPGHQIELIQKAPLGDPYYLRINDTHVAIRKDLAAEILIDLVTETHE